MRNPEKTDFNKEYFRTCNDGKPMSFSDFVNYWKLYKFIGDPHKYYAIVTGEKAPRKKKKDEAIDS